MNSKFPFQEQHAMPNKPAPTCPYTALIIRAWQEPNSVNRPVEWRFRIQRLKDEPPRGFASLEALLDFLQKEFGGESHEMTPVQKDKPT